jgi:polyisoprenoid-binding protein YceI
VEDGKLVGGVVVIDMNAMECTDLEGEMRDGLIGHLKSHDFFHTAEFPEATFRILSSERIGKARPGDQNLIVRAELEMKGKTAPVELGCIAGVTPEGNLAAQASFLIDRTAWNVIYGSGKFFHRLGQHLVNDLVDIEIKVVTTR